MTKLPSGTEKGACLAIDMGGTNLRVCSVTLHGDSTFSVIQSKAKIPLSLMTAETYRDLFRYVADHAEAFMRTHMPNEIEKWNELRASSGGDDASERLLKQKHAHPVGFTFSFTFDQSSINRGTLMYWTKAFAIQDAVGRDPCTMLQDALDERQLPLLVTALVNDTTGALAARAYCAPSAGGTLLGAIFGTGTNGAYMEKVSKITKLHKNPSASPEPPEQPAAYMALNTEWGGFDRELLVLPTTTYDRELDQASVNPDDQHFEKRVSGLYLGELWRKAILAAAAAASSSHLDNDRPFTFRIPEESPLRLANSIDSSFLSQLIRHMTSDVEAAKTFCTQFLGFEQALTTTEVRAMCIVAEAIGLRAARLSAVAIAGVVLQSGLLSATTPESGPTQPAASLSFLPRVNSMWSPYILSFLPSWCRCRLTPLRSDTEAPDTVDIGVDGSLFEHFPGFEHHMRSALRNIPGIGSQLERRIRIGATKDGSGVGAALVAMLHRPE